MNCRRPNFVRSLASIFCLSLLFGSGALGSAPTNNVIRFSVSSTPYNFGTFDVELYNVATPITVANFLKYVTDGDYVSSFFHRKSSLVDSGVEVLQGGGFGANASNLYYVPTDAAIANEASATYSNVRGTIAMARTAALDSATSQFYFNLNNANTVLDGSYAVFGNVTGAGMTVVDALSGLSPNPANVGIWNASSIEGSLGTLPLVNFPNTGQSIIPYLESVTAVTVLPSGPHAWKSGSGSWATASNWGFNAANLAGKTGSLSTALSTWVNSSTSWNVVPSGNDSMAVFGGTSGGTIDLVATSPTINTLAFSSLTSIGAYTFGSSAAGVLKLDGGTGSATIQLDVINSSTQTIAAPVAYVTNTNINNQSTGGANLVLSAQQNWNASTVTVTAGAVKFNNASAGTVTAGSATLAVNAGATVEFAGSSTATAQVNVTNNGTLTVSGSNQAGRLLAGTGDTTVAAAAALTIGTQTVSALTSGTGTISQGTLTVNGTLRNDGNSTFSSPFTASGAGAVNLSGSTATALSIGAAGSAKLGNVTLSNTNGGITIADGGSLIAGNITAQSGGTLTVGQGSTATLTQLSQGGQLRVKGNSGGTTAKLTIASSGTPVGPTVANRVGSLVIDNTSGAYYGTLDLGNSDLVINAGTTTLASVQDMIRSGSASSWTGKGMASSFAAANTFGQSGKTALGVIRNDNKPNTSTLDTPLYGTFSGATGLTGNEILVKYTYYGDFDLDGKVTAYDYALLDAGLSGATQDDGKPGWYFGDANYDGVVNAADTALFNTGRNYYNSGGYGQLPEPGTFILALLGIAGLFSRRCRRKLG